MIDLNPNRHYTLQEWSWCEASERALKPIMYGAETLIRCGVEQGLMRLWCVNGSGWCVTQCMPGMLFIWCFTGDHGRQFLAKMLEVARINGFKQLSFFTRHRTYARGLREFKPVIEPTPTDGEWQFTFNL